MRPVKLNDKWAINVFTKEFGEVIMLKEEGFLPLTFDKKDQAVEFICKIRIENGEVFEVIKESWKKHREHLNEVKSVYEVDELYSMKSADIEQVEWLINHIENLNGHINSLNGEINEKKVYNQKFLKLLRTQSCITDVIELINKRFEVEKQGEKFQW